MGYRSIAAVLHHSKAKANTRNVLLAIASFHDDRGQNGAWPSQEVIAELANVTTRTVQRAITELVELGEIEVLVHGGAGRKYDRQTNRYFIVLDCPVHCDGSVNHNCRDDKSDEPTRQIRQTNTTNWTDHDDSVVVLTVKNNQEQSLNSLSR